MELSILENDGIFVVNVTDHDAMNNQAAQEEYIKIYMVQPQTATI